MKALPSIKIALLTGLGLWIGVITLGFGKLFIYSNTPGKPAKSLTYWPTGSTILRKKDLPTLVIFAHAQCPCTKATLGELERLMPKIIERSAIYIEFFFPKEFVTEKSKGALWQKAESIPGIKLHQDIDGQEARRFGAETSGQVFLYNSDGILVFQGGITASRGHMGDNAGSDAILKLIQTNSKVDSASEAIISKTPVYGCSLKRPQRSSSNAEALTKL